MYCLHAARNSSADVYARYTQIAYALEIAAQKAD